MLEEWAPIAFNLVEYRDGVFILAGIDEIQTMLDDQIVKTQVHFQNVCCELVLQGARYILL